MGKPKLKKIRAKAQMDENQQEVGKMPKNLSFSSLQHNQYTDSCKKVDTYLTNAERNYLGCLGT